jgi:hypothetical protein
MLRQRFVFYRPAITAKRQATVLDVASSRRAVDILPASQANNSAT